MQHPLIMAYLKETMIFSESLQTLPQRKTLDLRQRRCSVRCALFSLPKAKAARVAVPVALLEANSSKDLSRHSSKEWALEVVAEGEVVLDPVDDSSLTSISSKLGEAEEEAVQVAAAAAEAVVVDGVALLALVSPVHLSLHMLFLKAECNSQDNLFQNL